MARRDDKPFLMGAETEYAVSGRAHGHYLEPDSVYQMLADALKAERRWVPDRGGYRGMYLEHGGRLYLDYGAHPEHATPECFTPTQVAAYDKAGEALLELARQRALAQRPGYKITLVKSNLDPVDPAVITYGTHESYTAWVTADVLGKQLLPHLASRVLYCGSGALTTQGHGFELSQRARHISVPIGHSTTGDRALYGTRIRKVSDFGNEGWVRVHLISKDAQRAPFGIYLTYATTGLLIEMVNRGHTVGKGLALAEPIRALRTFSLDPWLKTKAKLADGRELTALEVQYCYLEECEKALQQGGMPEWAPEAVRHWRETLEELEKGPLRLARKLDSYCKLLMLEHELLRAECDWTELRKALAKLALLRVGNDPKVAAAVLSDDPSGLSQEQTAHFDRARKDCGADNERGLERLRLAVRLQALDVHYHELGGLYDRLREARRVQWVVLSPAEVERATHEPPAGGRAAVRGAWVRDHAGEANWFADWQYLWHPPTGRCLDLRDPFSAEGHLRQLTVPDGVEPVSADVLDLLHEQSVAVA